MSCHVTGASQPTYHVWSAQANAFESKGADFTAETPVHQGVAPRLEQVTFAWDSLSLLVVDELCYMLDVLVDR